MPCRGTQPRVEGIGRQRGRNFIRLYVQLNTNGHKFVASTALSSKVSMVTVRGARFGLAAAVFTLPSTVGVPIQCRYAPRGFS